MTVTPWLLHRLCVHVCMCAHACVCVRARVSPGGCSAPQRGTPPLQGDSTFSHPQQHTRQWKAGQLLPGAHALWLPPLAFQPAPGAEHWAGRRKVKVSDALWHRRPPASPPIPVLLLWLSVHVPLSLLLPIHASLPV